jgi:hypothetical protein
MSEAPRILQNVALFGVPRSGTTWLGQLLNSSPSVLYRYQPLFSYEFKDFLNESSSQEDIEEFHNRLVKAESEFVKPLHQFNKSAPTHLVWKSVRYHYLAHRLLQESDIKLVFIKRNPLDVINSWYNAPREFSREEWNILTEWEKAEKKNLQRSEEYFGFNKWCEALMIHAQNATEFPDRVFLIDYDQAQLDQALMIESLFGWLGLPVASSTRRFMSESMNRDSDDTYSVFKKKSENTLPQTVKDAIVTRTEEFLSDLDVKYPNLSWG